MPPASRNPASPKKRHELRAFLIGASPDETVEHVRLVLHRLKADPATDLLIGVDGGTATWLKAGYRPHMAVGDWDSYRGAEARRTLKSLHHLTLPVDKERSDLFYAASVASNAEATQLICLGVTGGRPDQHLASVLDLASLAAGEAGEFSRVAAYSPEGEYHFLSPLIPRWKEAFPSPRTVSVFALPGAVRGLTLKGFKYPLKDARLEPSSHGLSNRSWAANCEVCVREGGLLVLVPNEAQRLRGA
jgi:thiamine pyrophosphokinase